MLATTRAGKWWPTSSRETRPYSIDNGRYGDEWRTQQWGHRPPAWRACRRCGCWRCCTTWSGERGTRARPPRWESTAGRWPRRSTPAGYHGGCTMRLGMHLLAGPGAAAATASAAESRQQWEQHLADGAAAPAGGAPGGRQCRGPAPGGTNSFSAPRPWSNGWRRWSHTGTRAVESNDGAWGAARPRPPRRRVPRSSAQSPAPGEAAACSAQWLHSSSQWRQARDATGRGDGSPDRYYARRSDCGSWSWP